MDSLAQPSAKLLYLINEMHKLKMISSIEKAQLKEFVIADHPVVFDLLKKYPTSQYELDLADALIEALRGPGSPTKNNIEEYEKENLQLQEEPQEISSPLGSQLMKRKKVNQTAIHEVKGLLQLTQQVNDQ